MFCHYPRSFKIFTLPKLQGRWALPELDSKLILDDLPKMVGWRKRFLTARGQARGFTMASKDKGKALALLEVHLVGSKREASTKAQVVPPKKRANAPLPIQEGAPTKDGHSASPVRTIGFPPRSSERSPLPPRRPSIKGDKGATFTMPEVP